MIKALLNCLLLVIAYAAKAQSVNPFGNALVPDMIADASIQEINGTFYCYATTDGYDQGLKTSGPPVVWKSKKSRIKEKKSLFYTIAGTGF